MQPNDLEARVAQLERRARWGRVVKVGFVAAVVGLLVVGAKETKHGEFDTLTVRKLMARSVDTGDLRAESGELDTLLAYRVETRSVLVGPEPEFVSPAAT